MESRWKRMNERTEKRNSVNHGSGTIAASAKLSVKLSRVARYLLAVDPLLTCQHRPGTLPRPCETKQEKEARRKQEARSKKQHGQGSSGEQAIWEGGKE